MISVQPDRKLALFTTVLLLALPLFSFQEAYAAGSIESVLLTFKAKLVPPESYPGLRKKLSEVSGRLEKALQANVPTSKVKTIHLISSKENNLAVYQTDTGEYEIAITLPAIDHAFREFNLINTESKSLDNTDNRDKRQAALNLGFERLVGEIAHEMGHIFDKEAKGADSKRGGFFDAQADSQSKERRADEHALTILRQAGFSPGIFPEAMQALEAEASSINHAVIAAISTHPHTPLRSSQMRLLATLDRFQKGSMSSNIISKEEELGAILEDIENIKVLRDGPPLSELRGKLDSVQHFIETNLELQTSIADGGKKAVSTLPYQQSIELQELLRSDPWRVKMKDLALIYGEVTEGMERRKQFGTPLQQEEREEFLDIFKRINHIRILDELLWHGTLEWPNLSRMNLLSEWIGNDHLIEVFNPENKNNSVFKNFMNDHYRSRFFDLIDSALPEKASQEWYSRHYFPKYPSAERYYDDHSSFLEKSPERGFNYFRAIQPKLQQPHLIDMLGESSFLKSIVELREYRKDLLNNPESREQFSSIAKYIYDHQSEFLTWELTCYDFSSHSYTTDRQKPPRIPWDKVFEILGIDPRIGALDLQKSLTNLFSSPKFWNDYDNRLKNKEDRCTRVFDGSYSESFSHHEGTESRGEIARQVSSDPSMLLPTWFSDWQEALLRDPEKYTDLSKALIAVESKFVENKQSSYFRDIVGRTPIRFNFMEEEFRRMHPGGFEKFNSCEQIRSMMKNWEQIRNRWLPTEVPLFSNISLGNREEDKRFLKNWIFEAKIAPSVQRSILNCILDQKHSDETVVSEIVDEMVKAGLYSLDEMNSQLDLRVSKRNGFFSKAGVSDYLAGHHFDSLSKEFDDAILEYAKDEKGSFEKLSDLMQRHFNHTQFIKAGWLSNTIRLRDTLISKLTENKLVSKFIDSCDIVQRPSSTEVSEYDVRARAFKSNCLLDLVRVMGPTAESDKLLRSLISVQDINSLPDPPLSELLHKKYHTPVQYSDIMDKVMDRLVVSSQTKHQSGVFREQIFKYLDTMMPEATPERDQILEKLAWGLDIQGTSDLQEWIESRKFNSQNLVSEGQLRGLSALAAEVEKFALADRKLVFQYLLNPRDTKLEEAVRQLIQGKADSNSTLRHDLVLELTKLREDLRTSPPIKRLPALELLLNLGHPPLISSALDELLSEELHYSIKQQKILKAFLRSMKPFEQGPSLAYLFAMNDEKGRGIKSLFEVFSTVGIKTGQLASIWNVFGKEISSELSSLKDDASPVNQMDKMAIVQALQENLAPSEYSQIHRVRKILGSASTKLVVLLEMADSKDPQKTVEIVAHIKRPYMQKTIESNLNLAKGFLTELEKEGFSKEVKATRSILSLVEQQLQEEVNPNKEREKTTKAASLYGSFEKPLKVTSGPVSGWTVQVPQYLEDGALPLKKGSSSDAAQLQFMEFAQGIPFEKISDGGIKKEAGFLIVNLSLGSLFDDCALNADPHTGNYLIDAKNRTLYPFDFGQLEQGSVSRSSMESDDRLVLAQFLKTLSEMPEYSGNSRALSIWIDQILDRAIPLSEKKVFSTAERIEFIHALEESLAQDHGAPALMTVVNQLIQSPYMPKREFSGFLKGLLILSKENYVEPSVFQQLLRQRIRTLFSSKASRIVLDQVSAYSSSTWELCRPAFQPYMNKIEKFLNQGLLDKMIDLGGDSCEGP